MANDRTESIVRDFVRLFNERRVDDLSELLTDDHLFVDALGKTIRGKRSMKEAWDKYFHMVSAYSIEIDEIEGTADRFDIRGRAKGAGREGVPQSTPWEIPASWRAVVRNGKIAEWRVGGE
ncbi:MAG: nuclear transport factor 2 family protein [Candidatus Krumholzibacteriota bacterium]|nr:nuclear transport factor 2 family protein [Candidatus Krumholzibacteriota bacterium]